MRELAGADSFFIEDLENSISTTSLNKEVAKLRGLSASIQNKLSAAISCGTSAISIPERVENGNVESASLKSKNPSSKQLSSLFEQNRHSLPHHQQQFREKYSSSQLTKKFSNSFKESKPQSKSSFMNLITHSKDSSTQSKSSFKLLPPQSARPLRHSPTPSETHLRQSKNHLKHLSAQSSNTLKQPRPRSRSHLRQCCNRSRINLKQPRSIVNLEKTRSVSKSALSPCHTHHKQHKGQSSCRAHERSTSPVRQTESSFFPSKQQSKSPARQSQSPLRQSKTKLKHSNDQSRSPLRKSCPHVKHRPIHSENPVNQSETEGQTPIPRPVNNSVQVNRLRSGATSFLKPSEGSRAPNHAHHESRASRLRHSQQNSEVNRGDTEHVLHRHRAKSPSKDSHSKTGSNISSKYSPTQLEKYSGTVEYVRHQSRAKSPSKDSHLKTESSISSKYSPTQIERNSVYLEHVSHQSRAKSPSKDSHPKTESYISSKYSPTQHKRFSGHLEHVSDRTMARSHSKDPKTESNISSKYSPTQLQRNRGSLEHVHHRHRAMSPSKDSQPKTESNRSSKYVSNQSETNSGTHHRSRTNSPQKHNEREEQVRHKYGSASALSHSQQTIKANSSSNIFRPQTTSNVTNVEHVCHHCTTNSPFKYSNEKSTRSSANNSSRHRSRSHSPTKHSHSKSEASYRTSRSKANSLTKLYASKQKNPEPTSRQAPESDALNYLTPKLEAISKALARSREQSPLRRYPSAVNMPSRTTLLSHAEANKSLKSFSSAQSMPKRSNKEMGCQIENLPSQTQSQAIPPTRSNERNPTVAKVPSNSTVISQTLRSASPRAVPKHSSKGKSSQTNKEENARNSELSALKDVLKQTLNPPRQAAGCHDCQTQTDVKFFDPNAKTISTKKSTSLMSIRQAAGSQPDTPKKNDCCGKCECVKNKLRKSIEEEETSTVARGSVEEEEKVISVANLASVSFIQEEKSLKKGSKTSNRSASSKKCSPNRSGSGLKGRRTSPKCVPSNKCKCVQVTPSQLNVADVPLSRQAKKPPCIPTRSNQQSAPATELRPCYCKPNQGKKSSKSSKSTCDNPAYYPPILDQNVLVRNCNYKKNPKAKQIPTPSCILSKNPFPKSVPSKTKAKAAPKSKCMCGRTCPCKASSGPDFRSATPRSSSPKCNVPATRSQSEMLTEKFSNISVNSKLVYPTDDYTDNPEFERIYSNTSVYKSVSAQKLNPSDKFTSTVPPPKISSEPKKDDCEPPPKKSSEKKSSEKKSKKDNCSSTQLIIPEDTSKSDCSDDYADVAPVDLSQSNDECEKYDSPGLTPLGKPNAIENLKKELICTFPTSCPCSPCFKTYAKSGCACRKPQKPSCCCPSPRNQVVCCVNQSSNKQNSPFKQIPTNYCYKPGCCPAQHCQPGGEATICCTIDPAEALKRLNNQKIKPQCQDKCIIEEILLGDCNATDDESDCNCNCTSTLYQSQRLGNYSSDSLVLSGNSDNCRCSGGGSGYNSGGDDCCAVKSHLDPICCCCCTYPSNKTDDGFWQKQVAINNLSALPCAQQACDPERGAEKITGENCVPPCRCCCRSRKRPPLPNYCKTQSCCKELSPCCSNTPSVCCDEVCCDGDDYGEEDTDSGCCCYCSQNPCSCTIDTITAPGPNCFYCKSRPCCCSDEGFSTSSSGCRCKGGGEGESTMSNDCDYAAEKDCSVRVAVRVRPQNPREVIDMCRICTTVTPGEPHVILGQDKAFTFDYVFDINCIQCDIYTKCVERLVEGALRGYNATVLAYGQTGSGKTFTMGTGFDHELNEIQQGIIPRAVRHIFAGIEEMQRHEFDDNGTQTNTTQFSVGAQFMELYNEEIFDLLDPYNKGRGGGFKIHEDCTGQISVSGATISPVHGPQDALRCLQQGALARTTAATQMNDQSSRSHALFTILIRRQRMLSPEESDCPEGDLETLTSKFHFVDLAGSERLKRTGATGERAREGISINCGLLALGNCISALGDKSKRATHVPYRDSKLTRLLQDSLGGNSQTLMIACVSPCDRDFMETLNTLKYANRARNIKNKVQLNQDQSSRTIAQLRREIAALQMELLEYKQGKRLLDDEGNSCLSDTFHENSMLLADNKRLQQRLKAMQETINVLTDNNTSLKVEKETHGWPTSSDTEKSVTNMVAGYLSEIEKLQAKLIESEEMYQQVKKNASGGSSHRAAAKLNSMENPADLINLAKRELEKDRELLMSRSLPGLQEDTNNSNNVVTTATNNESFESDSDTESDDKANEMQADLIDINTDIEIKSKLIEQLELSQQRMQLMRQHYEDKLSLLNSKIVNTQKERDEVLANLGPTPTNQPNEKVKKVKEEYERKINDMQREMKKLQHAQREHLRQQRELQAQEVKLRNLRSELTELKCIKTRLIRKMTEQTNRHKEEETRKAREIAQLRKEQRRQQNAVKSLQAQVHAKDQILKRKTEEVTALRRSKRDKLSQKASGRVPSKNRENDITAFNARQARQRWDNLYRAMTRASRNKQAVMQLEKELERLMNEREALCRDLTAMQKRQRNSGTKNIDLANEEDTIKSNLNYVQDNIAHVQQAIMEFEESKDTSSNDTQNLQLLIQNVNNMDEAKFLLEHLTNSAVMFQCDSALTQNRLAEHESLLKEVQQESSIQQQLLQHFLAQNNSIQIADLFASLHLDGSGGGDGGEKLNSNNLSGSQKSLNSNGTYDIPCDGGVGGNMSGSYVVQRKSISRSPSPTPTVDLLHDKNAKVRRRTAQPQDLLFGEVSHNGDDAMTRSYTQQDTTQRNFHPLMRVPSAPGSLKQALNSPSLTKKNIETAMAVNQPQSPRLTRRGMPNKGSPGLDDDALMAPQSPPVYRRMISREENSNGGSGSSTDVFSRLGAGTQDPAPGGSIHKVTGKIRVGVPLYCTHTVSGHNNSVLSIKVDDDDILYTAAADRTVKVWDLSREVAQHCLSTHPGPVIAVQNDKNTRLLFSASGPYVRVWDLRTSNSKPIKTLTSSGQVLAGNANITGVAPGESPITALCMGNSGNLYVAASDKVRIWDLKNISCVGKLSGGHQAAVMCVTAWEGDGGDSDGSTDFVATGSKDHYVKVFEVPKAGGVVYPLLNLEPPHYDGVQALAVAPDAVGADAELFSGSRDSGIKRWDLKSGELKQSLNNAHKGWVSGMAISGDVLLSGCRGGIVRLWNVRTCESLAELKTDLMINDIVASGQRVFTASSSGEVRIWRFAPQEHFSTSNMTSSSIEKK